MAKFAPSKTNQMQYHHVEIEKKWQEYWAKNKTFKAENHSEKPKYYVLDMFPYPSGAGLHVGHPLGYIASDIFSRYKRLKGFNVLHPMGYDSFGLPAEQYAIQTGQHPAVTTKVNIEGGVDKQGNQIEGYRKQLDRIGFSYDWDREVRTSDPDYYKWTQWIFIQLFNSYYDNDLDKAVSIDELIQKFEKEGNLKVNAACDEDTPHFTAEQWKSFSEKQQQEILLKYRLTYLAEAEVNWCPALGTVLANDEVVNGVSERGGFPVIRKKMTQWMMRITAFAERLLNDLDKIDWPQPIKDAQTYWIGKSKGASIKFEVLSPALSKGEGAQKPGYMTGGNNASILIENAKGMRKEPTEAEGFLWQQLRNKNLDEKFRRQHLIEDFIVDFVCLSKGLVIEVDGGIHDAQQEYDEQRTLILNEKGFKVIRFKNEEVLGNIESVLTKIKEELKNQGDEKAPSPLERVGERIEVFTTRPDTVFGVSYVTLAPEHPFVKKIVTEDRKESVFNYIEQTSKRSERERMADVTKITGEFTGAYAVHPLTGKEIPIWIGDYVLSSYGTGAVMAVPAGDERDYKFAKHFNLPIPNIFKDKDISEAAFIDKEGFELENSEVLNGLNYKQATDKIIHILEENGLGKGKINYRLRDAVFSRQRYWGEPVPAYYKDGVPYMIEPEHLPLVLPEVDEYLPTETGEPPLGRAKDWAWDTSKNEIVSVDEIDEQNVFPLELNTMPGWAGSSWYFLRYMDAKNEQEFASREAMDYWQNVDLYMGGSEHATGHLLYARFWQKFLYDRGLVPTDEFAKKLINQGMILGMSAFAYRIHLTFIKSINSPQDSFIGTHTDNSFSEFFTILVSKNRKENYEKTQNIEDLGSEFKEYIDRKLKEDNNNEFVEQSDYDIEFHPIHIDISLIDESTNELYIEKFKLNSLYQDYKDAIFIYEENGKFLTSREVEKMSKSKYNVINPDDICEQYGADTLRLYEMFLGPIEQAKPWNTQGLSGVYSFLKKLWRLYHSPSNSPEGGESGTFYVSDEEATKEEMKVLHQTIKKVDEDIHNFSFNTSVSNFMIVVNELTKLNCNKRAVLEPLAVLISPYAPHIAEELWQKLGHNESISFAEFPEFDAKWLVEDAKEYPVSFNGKMRFKLELPMDLTKDQIQEAVMADERTQKQLEGRIPKNVIIVPGKIINIVG